MVGTENQINYLEHKEAEKQPIRITRRKKNRKKKENSVSSLWDNVKYSNICIIGVPEEEEKEQEIGNLFEKQ